MAITWIKIPTFAFDVGEKDHRTTLEGKWIKILPQSYSKGRHTPPSRWQHGPLIHSPGYSYSVLPKTEIESYPKQEGIRPSKLLLDLRQDLKSLTGYQHPWSSSPCSILTTMNLTVCTHPTPPLPPPWSFSHIYLSLPQRNKPILFSYSQPFTSSLFWFQILHCFPQKPQPGAAVSPTHSPVPSSYHQLDGRLLQLLFLVHPHCLESCSERRRWLTHLCSVTQWTNEGMILSC